MLRSSRALRGSLALALCAALAPRLQAEDPLKDIKAKEAEKRVAAVAGLKALGGEAAEKALVSALIDKDWEVVELAALALRDLGTKAAVPQLVKTAIDAPAARMRRAAALALAKIDAAKATEDLAKQAAGKNAMRAWAALALVAPAAAGTEAESITKNLKKSQKAKETEEKLAAAGAIACGTKEEMLASLEGYLAGDNLAYTAAALRSAASRPDAELLPRLQAALAKPRIDDTLERRLIGAVAAIAPSLDAAAVIGVLETLAKSGEADVAASAMRLARELAAIDGTRSAALTVLEAGLSHAKEEVCAAALHAGAALKHEAVLRKARDLAEKHKSDRVRLLAIRELREQVGVGEKDVADLCVKVLENDVDPLVREEAAVALAKSNTDAAVNALAKAVNDSDWAVAACAAVSLGKTTNAKAVDPLLALAKHEEWKRRGAAIVGLCHVTKNEAVPAILAAIGDDEPAIANTALIYAKALIKKDLGKDVAKWQEWWAENGKSIKMWTPEESKARREKYGYATSLTDVFKDLDVIVLDSRGDHIQTVLDRVRLDNTRAEPGKTDVSKKAIHYRMTAAARVKADGIHPHGVYISNCTGEVESEDIEHIAWFVRTGGYFFGSCWSVRETVEKVYGGVVKAYPREDVVGTVSAEPIAPKSPYLAGVFDGGVEPHYNLEGPHLIEVLDPERCEVLVDSPECASLYGNGNLTVWFRAGHGLVLQSVNHFDNQGLLNANWLKDDEECQAYAIDRMALPYSEWRATQNEKWWGSNTKAAERVFDRTALNLVANFVRAKRLEEM